MTQSNHNARARTIDMLRIAAGGALMAAALLATGAARAQTVDTFSFTDPGFSGQISPGQTGMLSGTFQGILEANNTIQLADLVSFKLTYVSGATTLFGYGPATFFSFMPGSNSTLDFAAPIGVNSTACVGAVAAFGLHGCGAGGVNGEVAGLDITQALPVVTLVSSFYVPPPVQPVATPAPTPPSGSTPPTPVTEPASLVVLGAGLCWLGMLRRSGSRRAVA